MNSFKNILYYEECVIGEGGYRKVYQCRLNPDWVVKIAKDTYGAHHNILESNIWDVIRYRDEQKWFAPVIQVSDNGRVLIQYKTEPIIRYPKLLPNKIPVWLSDIKNSNFGFIKKQLVTHDYAFTLSKLLDNLSTKMQSVKWSY